MFENLSKWVHYKSWITRKLCNVRIYHSFDLTRNKPTKSKNSKRKMPSLSQNGISIQEDTYAHDPIIRPALLTKIQDNPKFDAVLFKTKKKVIKRPIITDIIDQPLTEVHKHTNSFTDFVPYDKSKSIHQERIMKIKEIAKNLPKKEFGVGWTIMCQVVEEFTRENKLVCRTRTYVIEVPEY
jgi:hypothetical protein